MTPRPTSTSVLRMEWSVCRDRSRSAWSAGAFNAQQIRRREALDFVSFHRVRHAADVDVTRELLGVYDHF